ncbi:hypothetical protein C0J52_17555 [Blattella germanica]|nr:hypothetical protein C0J52_17555 [Blattella germanica]
MLTIARKKLFPSNDNLKKVLFAFIIVVTIFFLLHPGRFASSDYPSIKHDKIAEELDPSPHALLIVKESDEFLCPLIPENIENSLQFPKGPASDSDMQNLSHTLKIEKGGAWRPSDCVSQHDVAIVVPYRNRTIQLNTFLPYMHQYLQKQKINYRIFIVEQSMQEAFNRAKLLNIGYVEALKHFPFHCFIFHDVDLIPQKLSNIYGCTHQPRHMSSSLNTFRYKLPYYELFGGVVAILKTQFELVNGFSNIFFGWGGEDDDFYSRIVNKGMSICRFPPDIARYTMLTHEKESPSTNRFQNLESGRDRFETDGLNTLKYTVKKIVYFPLYTGILVDI